MTFGDVQRQTSCYIPNKFKSYGYINRVINRYSNLQHIQKGIDVDGKMNHAMRYGLPKQDTAYIIKCYDELQKFIKLHGKDKPNSVTRKVSDRLSNMVFKMESRYRPTKAQRYGLRIPKSLTVVEPKVRNGERIHISLQEIGL
jgi:hypothetical protein